MTAAGAVRPFSARVVRQDWAARAAAPMADALAPGERQRREPVPSSAYGEERRSLFVYRIRNGAGDHVGVIAGVRLDAFADGRVRGHESVEPHRVEALVALYADQPTRSEPVALLHDQPAEATALVGKVTATEPLLTFPGPDGNEHTLWPVDDDVADELAHALGDGVHYIADGHHRVAARLQAWEAAGRPAEGAVLCVLYPLDGLRLSSFHRRVVGPVDADALVQAATKDFEVAEGAPHGDGIALYADGRWWRLLVRPGTRPDGVAGLDVTLLQECLLGPVLGITGREHPRLEVHPAHVPVEMLTARCDEDGGALFVLQPPTLAALIRVADLGEQMPPKSTYFSPKPCAGIFLV